MSILDTTIVNVALETLSVDLDAPIGSVQWVVTGYMLALAAVIPVTGWAARRIGTRRLYLDLARPLHARLDALRPRVVDRLADRLPRPPGPRWRDADADRDDHPRPRRRPSADGPHPQRDRRPDGARAGLRARPRRPPRRARRLALDLLRQHPRRHRRRRRSRCASSRRAAPRKPGRSTGSGSLLLSHRPADADLRARRRRERRRLRLAAGVRSDARGRAPHRAFVVHSLRSSHPLLNVRLYANRAFAAASATTFCLGATLFGAMILLPLYFQIVRHESVVADRPAARPAEPRRRARDAVRRAAGRPLRRRPDRARGRHPDGA